MCITQFREQCKKGKFYYFPTPEDFDKKLHYGKEKIPKNVKFTMGLIDNGVDSPPTRYSAYGVTR